MSHKVYVFDLPVDVIARACQLNQCTVEQVLKGMQSEEVSEDIVCVIAPETSKEVYTATRKKVSCWVLR